MQSRITFDTQLKITLTIVCQIFTFSKRDVLSRSPFFNGPNNFLNPIALTWMRYSTGLSLSLYKAYTTIYSILNLISSLKSYRDVHEKIPMSKG